MSRRGLSLIEVIVTLAVLSLVTAVGVRIVPELLNRSSLTESQATLSRAAVAQTSFAGLHGRYATDDVELETLATGRSLTLTTGASTTPNVVSVALAENGGVLLAVRTKTGLCLGTLLGDPLVNTSKSEIEAVDLDTCTAESLLSLG